MPENSRRTFAKAAIIGVTGLGLVTFYKGCPDQSTQVWNLAKENLWYLFEREKRAVMAYGRQLLAKEIKERIGYVPLQVALTTFHLTRLVVTTFAAVVTGLDAAVQGAYDEGRQGRVRSDDGSCRCVTHRSGEGLCFCVGEKYRSISEGDK